MVITAAVASATKRKAPRNVSGGMPPCVGVFEPAAPMSNDRDEQTSRQLRSSLAKRSVIAP